MAPVTHNIPLKLAILGANGQVASEVALFLSRRDDVQLQGFVRSSYGAILLDLAGIPSATLDYGDITGDTRRLLSEADAVVDCTYPAGQTHSLPKMIEANARAVMGCMKRGAVYIHMSSISAFGMPANLTELHHYRIARTPYARTKRLAEKSISGLSRHHHLRSCHLRLGQVHGVLQSVTRHFRGLIEYGEIHSSGSPDALSTTVFAHSIAEAILKAARGEFPDAQVVTVVSQPQWTLATLSDVYRQISGIDFTVHYSQAARPSEGNARTLLPRLMKIAAPYREVLESQVLLRFPQLMPRLKGQHRMRSVARDRAEPQGHVEPVTHLIGLVPGPVAPDVQSSPEATVAAFSEIERLLANTLESATA